MNRLKQILIFLFCLLFLLSSPVATATDRPASKQKTRTDSGKILVLKTYPVGLPIPDSIDRGLLIAIKEAGVSTEDLIIENLDLSRGMDVQHRSNLARLLHHKLAGKKIGLVIVEGLPAVKFITNELADMFSDTPLLTITVPDIEPLKGGNRRIIDIPWRVDPAGTLKATLHLFPKTRRVLVVTGADEGVLPFLAEAKQAFAPWRGELQFEYTNRMTYPEMLERVSSLPRDTVVIYSPFFTDARGKTFVPAEVVAEVCRTAKVPVFATLESYLGLGVVGGSLLQTEEIGRYAGKLALSYLNGTLELRDQVTTFSIPGRMMFDWRELNRWQADTNRLPKGSTVINLPPSLWNDYRQFAVWGVIILALQAGLIIALLEMRRRRNREGQSRERIEKALKLSEEKFRLVVEKANEGIVVIQDGKYKFVNDWMLEIFKMSRGDLLSTELMSMVHPDDKKMLFDRVDNRLSGKPVKDVIEHRIFDAEGQLRWVETRGVLSDWEGQSASIAFTTDITDRKQAEEALRVSEEKYRELVQSAHSLIVRLDPKGRITFINDFAQSFFGYTEKELLNRDLVGSLAPETESTGRDLTGLIDRLLENPDKYLTNENENVKANGERAWMAWANRPIFNDQGQFTGLLCIGNDITKRKRAEEENKRLEAQLRQSQKMEAVGTLAGGIAHDFNNILAAIIGFTDLSLEDLTDGMPVRSNLEKIRKSALRARNLVKQILSFSRQEDQVKTPVQLEPIVKEILEMLRATLPSTIDLQLEMGEGLWVVQADSTQINQLLLNLVTNAADALREEGGLIRVELENVIVDRELAEKHPDLTEDKNVRITVRDSGSGIPDTVFDRIFEPFFTTKEVGSGTGMGLSVVHGIVAGHGGAVVVESAPGQGAVFQIYLPISENQSVSTETEQPEAPQSGVGRVLFVDDEIVLADFTERVLTRLGYTPTVKTSSPEALEVFKADPDGFDLVITDMTMPSLTGVDLAREILAIRPELPIILCTGYSNQIDEGRARQIGIRKMLLKPLSISQLGKAINAVIKGD